MTTSCINESPFAFAYSDPLAPPPPTIINRSIPKIVVTDEDIKGNYRSAVAAWVIVLIIIALITIGVMYVWWKGKNIMGELSNEIIKYETVANQRRAETEVQKILITGGHMKGGNSPTKGGPSGSTKGNLYEINNPTATDHLVHDDDEEDELEAIYNIDGTLNRFQQRATTVALKRGPRENAQL